MAMKIPCITSPLANQALHAREGEEILVAQSPEDYARHILFLLANPERAARIGLNGYYFVHQNYSWEKETAKIDRLISASGSSTRN
jgi:spore maturation protein CgeB